MDSPTPARTPSPHHPIYPDVLPADRAETITDLRLGVPPGDLRRGAAVTILTSFDGGSMAAPHGCLHAYLETGIDASGLARITVAYRALYDEANRAGDSAVPAGVRAAVLLACSLVTGQPAPHLAYWADVWELQDRRVVLHGLAVLLGLAGEDPGAVVPQLLRQVIGHEVTVRRLRALCRPDGSAPGAGAALMREAADEPTDAAGRPVLPGVWAVTVADVEAVLDGQPSAADAPPQRAAVLRGAAVVDLHPTAGPAPTGPTDEDGPPAR